MVDVGSHSQQNDRGRARVALGAREELTFSPKARRTILAARNPDWSGDMAFQLKAKESVSDGIRRHVRRQIEKALKHLGAKRTRLAPDRTATSQGARSFTS
jgi:hypothetical protein